MSEHQQDGKAEAVPKDQTETRPSLTPTDASTDPAAAAEEERRIDSDAGLSGAVQQGGAAIANIGKPRGSELFRE
ncbi:hypothetical protein [Phenylobacterium sp.]|uniref:hypothetical protein n=1 Tax=Phenylobacterium sp. TaxID=1871053 RepID=UPI00286D62A2|nr:hypothetical protein [Phenylobacterium sp.]